MLLVIQSICKVDLFNISRQLSSFYTDAFEKIEINFDCFIQNGELKLIFFN